MELYGILVIAVCVGIVLAFVIPGMRKRK